MLISQEDFCKEIKVLNDTLIIVGFKSERSNSRVILNNVTKEKLVTMRQDAVKFHLRRANGEFKK